MSRKRTVGTSLSVRARNVLCLILYGSLVTDKELATLNASSRETLRARLQARVTSDNSAWAPNIPRLLRRTRHCGVTTTQEILSWIGLTSRYSKHKCVCRTCGKRLP